jgi:hypothetical protein
VWPEFDPDIHILREVKRDAEGWVTHEEVKRLGITEFYAGVDFGFDNSGVMLVGGYTRERKLVIVAEVFHSRQGVEWWRDWVVKIHKRFPISIGWCDHNRPDWITAWNDSIGVPKDGPGAVFVKADKGVDRGLEIVRRRLNRSDPSVHFVHDALLHPPDPELLDRHVAWRTIDCIPEYVYKRASYSDDQADDTGARPDKPDKSKATSDGCFVAGTLVATPRGNQRIETLRIGDEVLTPYGARRVIDAGMTDPNARVWRLDTEDGRSILATGNHPIWTRNGFTRLDALRYGDIIATWQKQNESSGVEPDGVDTPTRGTHRSETISGVKSARKLSGFTRKFTARITDLFLRACACITSITTRSTTTLQTLFFGRLASIHANTSTRSIARVSLPQHGMEAKPESSGTGSARKNSGSVTSILVSRNAPSVNRSSSCELDALDSARTTASRPSDVDLESMTRRATASGASPSIESIGTARSDIALSRVVSLHAEPFAAPVFNLTVEGEHVYFANGVLVSNCDALRYLCVGLEYFEPEDSLAMPLNANYRAKLMFGRKVRGEDVDLADDEEMSEIDVQDWIVDTIRAAANNGYEN